ncbi:MAG: tetratricopeptide repeat protein, partial [Proteobacteria bacterium]|nr:tetratricopeptide repeat protein [Pseudomonadota bacterium]
VESVFLLLDSSAPPTVREQSRAWLKSVLPSLNWRSHIFVCSAESVGEWAELIGDFVEENELAIVLFHPIVSMKKLDRDEWLPLLATAMPFQRTAYEEQSESRLVITPIVEPEQELSSAEVQAAADFFNSHSATPSFFVTGEQALRPGQRTYLKKDDSGGTIEILWASHVAESVLKGLEEESNLLAPCRAHLVLDESSGNLFPCFEAWERGECASRLVEPVAEAGPLEWCADCIGRSLVAVQDDLVANDRREEARKACLEVASACSAIDRHRLAADLAHVSKEMSASGEGRAAALICEAMSLAGLMELEEAEEALLEAKKCPVDQGFVAYQRGRVQFLWRDYIEALDRYEEALKAGSMQIPLEDICYQMALCHINLEEYNDAMPHLERSVGQGPVTAPAAFYRGICELGQGNVEPAMAHFSKAREIGPAKEDLGRVLFYIGTCLKELERHDEAIEVLVQAVETDPQDITNHNLLGFCYYITKQHEEAIQCFLRAVEIDPRSGIDWANLGSNLRELGRIDDAILMYKKALSLDPSLGWVRLNLARLTE